MDRAIEAAKTVKRLNELLDRLATPPRARPRLRQRQLPLPRLPRDEAARDRASASGSRTSSPATSRASIHVNARQFFGLDINAFAIELAKVSMMIGRKLAIDELHIAERRSAAGQP